MTSGHLENCQFPVVNSPSVPILRLPFPLPPSPFSLPASAHADPPDRSWDCTPQRTRALRVAPLLIVPGRGLHSLPDIASQPQGTSPEPMHLDQR